MTILEAMRQRHSVRSYEDRPLDEKALETLVQEIALCNAKGDLHIQLITQDPETFQGFLAHYGRFSGVQHYIALVGKKSHHLEEKLGYYGEHLVLLAQMLGLNTCWVAATFRKGKCPAVIQEGEKLVCVISLGYGTTQGVPHKSKSMDSLCNVRGNLPQWFRSGMEAALLAPTAMNQQKFRVKLQQKDPEKDLQPDPVRQEKEDLIGCCPPIKCNGHTVEILSLPGFYSKVDLGIVKYHFEKGAKEETYIWW